MSAPPLVAWARAAAQALGFEASSRERDGELLHVLAARRGIERVAEIGTGAGIGTAWLASALPPGVPVYTAEPDPALARAAADLFADDPDVHVLEGEWRVVLRPHAPFDLISLDGSGAGADPDVVLELAAPGATLVLDDVPGDRPPPRRDGWLTHPRLVAVEVGTAGGAVALVATVRR